jgi:hypothetical protein
VQEWRQVERDIWGDVKFVVVVDVREVVVEKGKGL